MEMVRRGSSGPARGERHGDRSGHGEEEVCSVLREVWECRAGIQEQSEARDGHVGCEASAAANRRKETKGKKDGKGGM